MALRTLSLEDIRTVPEANKIFKEMVEADPFSFSEDFKKMLYDIGIDVARGVECEVVLHRPLTSTSEVMGPRWIGHERRDPEWMASEHCTWENRLEVIGVTDLEFQKDLVEMGSTPNYTAMFIRSIESDTKAKKNKAGAK